MQTIYFNNKTNHLIVDVSAKKGAEKIAEEFGEGFDQAITIDEVKQTYTIVKGKLKLSEL